MQSLCGATLIPHTHTLPSAETKGGNNNLAIPGITCAGVFYSVNTMRWHGAKDGRIDQPCRLQVLHLGQGLRW